MASKRSRSNPKTKSMTSAPALVQRFAIFGPPPLLEGEDAALYEELLGRMCAAVKPLDIIDEMFVVDVVFLEWEIVRWRRLKLNRLQASVCETLQYFLKEQLASDPDTEAFSDFLAEFLEEYLAEDEARLLARQCARSQPDAMDKARRILEKDGLEMDRIMDDAMARKATELAERYVRHEPAATKRVNELLVSGSRTMHDLMREGFPIELDEIERIDRLITIAETRRNMSLRELDRRRAALGEALRRKVQEVEEAEFEVIETTPADRQRRA
jgi:hypothetical protein